MVRRDAREHATKSEGFCLLAILVSNFSIGVLSRQAFES
jgi:hypothetical protein